MDFQSIIDTARTYVESINLEALPMDAIRELLLYKQDAPLMFNTGLFLVLFVVFLAIYQVVRRWHNARMLLVILFSLYFYYKSSSVYCLILLGVCLSDYLIGLAMGATRRRWLKRLLVAVNVLANVGMLAYFKYFNMLYETFANIAHTSFDPLDIILPAGISFFCFRSISYIVDIYRGKMEPARNFLEYCFFLTFFPPLLAGPVVRASDMLPQIQARPKATHAMVSEGLILIMAGLVKKVILADFIASGFVDRIFENPALYTGFENLLGVLGFTIQLYCDFSGYSDMAIGLALLLGYRFAPNFNAPFKAQNPTEFWHRWHISLSTWLRDYLYIPLGGNRRGTGRQHANLVTTMVIGGLWHGASWMYVLWGAYHGLLLVGHKVFSRLFRLPKRMSETAIIRGFNIFVTFTLMAIGFALFRAESMMHLRDMGDRILHHFHPEVAMPFVQGYMTIVTAIVTAYVLHFLPTSWNGKTHRLFARLPLVAQAVIVALVLFLVIQARQTDLVPFLYLKY